MSLVVGVRSGGREWGYRVGSGGVGECLGVSGGGRGYGVGGRGSVSGVGVGYRISRTGSLHTRNGYCTVPVLPVQYPLRVVSG